MSKPPDTLLTDDMLRAIGRVAVLAGRLELDQAFLTGSLVGPDPETRDVLARPADNFGVLQTLAKRMVVARYAAHQFRDEHRLKAEIEAWMREACKLMDDRNEVMHGMWGIGPDGPGYITKRKPHTSKMMTVESLDALAERIDAHSQRSHDLVQEVTDAVLERTRFVLALMDGADPEHAEGPAT